MKFWFDTEFYEDGHKIDLISIGVVAEDGRTYYAETPHAHMLASATPWLRENVHPHLRGPHVERKQIADDLIQFMGERPEIWAYYADYDWVALCQIFGTMMQLPKGWPMYCRDVKQLCDTIGNPKLPDQGPDTEHHALNDALWTKQAWQFLAARTRINLRPSPKRICAMTTKLPYPKPAGEYVLVPTEPTTEMLNAYDEARAATTMTASNGVTTYNPHQSYWAMLAVVQKTHEAVGDNLVPHGPTFHWRNGWMFARGEARDVHIWNIERGIDLIIPAAEWDSITSALTSANCWSQEKPNEQA